MNKKNWKQNDKCFFFFIFFLILVSFYCFFRFSKMIKKIKKIYSFLTKAGKWHCLSVTHRKCTKKENQTLQKIIFHSIFAVFDREIDRLRHMMANVHAEKNRDFWREYFFLHRKFRKKQSACLVLKVGCFGSKCPEKNRSTGGSLPYFFAGKWCPPM